MRLSAAVAGSLFLAGTFVGAAAVRAEGEPLHVLIDQRLASPIGIQPAQCTDAEFMRRVSLDLTGMPPTADEARAFLADSAADKRARLIDRLFASPHFARHWAAVLDLFLMERRSNTHVPADDWQAWLVKQVRQNVPWNQLVRDILQADGSDPTQRPAARFVLDRGSDPHGLTRDVGRIFFGRDIQCAQCHNHPLVDDYLQSDYHGLLAFLSPGYAFVRKDGDKEITIHAEKAGGDDSFESVFDHLPRRTGPRPPGGLTVDEPFLLPGEDYEVEPADKVKPVPKISRRAKLAELATDGTNQAFNWNIVNRLWAHMFGRGLVHPPDLMHSANPPSDPELLRTLADCFVRMNFDMRQFLRELALSGAYQRSFDRPADVAEDSAMAVAEVGRLEQQRAELTERVAASGDAFSTALEAWQAAETAWMPTAGELDTARNQYGEAKKKFDEAKKALADVTSQLDGKRSVAEPVQQASTAAQAAVKLLPEDKELADAAQKFAARAQKLSEEMAALAKSVEEKNAAVGPLSQAMDVARPPIDTARSKVTPLVESLRTAEQAMLAARTAAMTDAEALAALERRLATVQQIASLPKRHQELAGARESAAARDAELASAQQELASLVAKASQQESLVQTAANAATVASSAVQSLMADQARQIEGAQAIVAAYAAAKTAREKLPNDASLASVVGELEQRANLAQSEMGAFQAKSAELTANQKSADEALIAAQESLAAVLAERSRCQATVEAAGQALAAAQAECTAKQSVADTTEADLVDRWTADFTVASLKPLTPEQLCWSIFRVTGVYKNYWSTEVAELDKASPLTDTQRQDPVQLAARDVELEQRTYDKLKGNVATFVKFYGAAGGQPQGDFFATADQALFTANGGSINSWVAPSSDNVTDRIVKQTDPRAAAEELYLGVLTRYPTDEEAAEVDKFLAGRTSDRAVAAQELVWGLLNSAEFRFNH